MGVLCPCVFKGLTTRLYLDVKPPASWFVFCKVDKGRDWTERALLLDPDLGDVWAMYYSHELLHDPTRAAAVLARAVNQVSHF